MRPPSSRPRSEPTKRAVLPKNLQPSTPAVAPRQLPWWNRRWKLTVALGVVASLLLLSGFVAAVCSLTFGIMKKSGAYQQAVAAARADSHVIATLGTPIEEGFFVMGRIELINDGGYANLSIPITGPNGAATIYAEADKSRGQWSFHTLEVMVEDTGEWIHLGGQR